MTAHNLLFVTAILPCLAHLPLWDFLHSPSCNMLRVWTWWILAVEIHYVTAGDEAQITRKMRLIPLSQITASLGAALFCFVGAAVVRESCVSLLHKNLCMIAACLYWHFMFSAEDLVESWRDIKSQYQIFVLLTSGKRQITTNVHSQKGALPTAESGMGLTKDWNRQKQSLAMLTAFYVTHGKEIFYLW